MEQTIVPGVWSWSRWQPDRALNFNGFFIESAEGNLVVDPIEPGEELLADLRARGVAAVLVTNRDHERATAAVGEATGAQIIASALDEPSLAVRAHRTVAPGDVVFGWTVIGLDGFKTAGEIALYDRSRRTAIVGDALWGKPAGALTLMPDAKLADPVRAALSARALRALSIDHLLVGDGASVFGKAHDAIGAMLDAREGVAINRINVLDEVIMRKDARSAAVHRRLGRGRSRNRRRAVGVWRDAAFARRVVLPLSLAYARRGALRRPSRYADAAHTVGDVHAARRGLRRVRDGTARGAPLVQRRRRGRNRAGRRQYRPGRRLLLSGLTQVRGRSDGDAGAGGAPAGVFRGRGVMLAVLLATAVATTPPGLCPSDPLIANPSLKIVRARDRAFDHYIVTVDVKNAGRVGQPPATAQHLELVQHGNVLGKQPIPVLGMQESYVAAFRVRLAHQSPRPPFTVEFRYVLDSTNAARANCNPSNDRLSATL